MFRLTKRAASQSHTECRRTPCFSCKRCRFHVEDPLPYTIASTSYETRHYNLPFGLQCLERCIGQPQTTRKKGSGKANERNVVPAAATTARKRRFQHECQLWTPGCKLRHRTSPHSCVDGQQPQSSLPRGNAAHVQKCQATANAN
jgi:hypothetical protein